MAKREAVGSAEVRRSVCVRAGREPLRFAGSQCIMQHCELLAFADENFGNSRAAASGECQMLMQAVLPKGAVAATGTQSASHDCVCEHNVKSA
jgi:hypothetical protein